MKTFCYRARLSNYILLVLTVAALSAACGKQENKPVENVAQTPSAKASRSPNVTARLIRATRA